MKHAIVTGATGYVGGHLCRQLREAGWRVTGLVRAGREAAVPGGVEAKVAGDLETRVQLLRAIRPQAVFHLAAVAKAAHEPKDLPAMLDANVRLGAELLESIRVADPSCVFVGAGTFWQHAAGTAAAAPNSLYAATKQMLEDLGEFYRAQAGLRVVFLKLYDVYGEDDPRDRLFAALRRARLSGETLALTPGEQIVHLVHVEDAARAFLHAYELLASGRQLELSHTVQSPTPMRLSEIVRLYQAQAGAAVPVTLGGKPYRQGEIMRPFTGAPLPGFHARVTVEQGIGRLVSQ